VRVNPSDIGKVIGRQGRTASSLRTVIGALAGDEPAASQVLLPDPDVVRIGDDARDEVFQGVG
jgi:hypothetical protein